MSFSVITAFLLGTLVGVIVVRLLLHASTRLIYHDVWRIDVRAMGGCRIDKIAAVMRFLHQLTGVVIEAEFNGITLVYNSYTTPQQIIDAYRKHTHRCVEEPPETSDVD